MMDQYIYWRHPTVPGIKVEEVSGAEGMKNTIWLQGALQVYCENGKDDYREIGHFRNGAPFLYGGDERISITHCRGLLAVATLAPTPDIDLSTFNEKTALGIDAEPADRRQVLDIRQRFLSEEELKAVPADDLQANILAWTSKEAAYKARLKEGLDFRKDIKISRFPRFLPSTPIFVAKEYGLPEGTHTLPDDFYGEITAGDVKFHLFSYLSEGCVVTIAFAPSTVRLGKNFRP